jgi:hypothetical protein
MQDCKILVYSFLWKFSEISVKNFRQSNGIYVLVLGNGVASFVINLRDSW